ncbi:hypothetical protein HHK36_018651 [Tetracentron sinense]|uniref:Biogenesis of lysosome-related organelles complex 1 subunit 1 n=1 Tax=Tetracentron sinense TaxID=13715 RepID=A0A834Z2K8_TETSI|nr:hypothetical protein HHK36_018651 [Tetracentron sinense]
MYPSLSGVRDRHSCSEMEKPKAEVGGLESSLIQLVHDHHQSSLRLREQTDRTHTRNQMRGLGNLQFITEKAKKDAIRSATRVSDILVGTVNGGVQESFINEKRIELEIRALVTTIIRYTKQTDQWLAASHSINSAVKEIGDFENWMKTMDYDCRSINSAIRNIHQS